MHQNGELRMVWGGGGGVGPHVGCSGVCNIRRFANLCEFVSQICKFVLEKLKHQCPDSITNLRISIDNLQNYMEVCIPLEFKSEFS